MYRSSPPRISRAQPSLSSALWAVSLLVAFVAVYVVAVHTEVGQRADQRAFLSLRGTGATADLPHVVGLGSVTDLRLWLVSVVAIIGLGLLAHRRLSIVVLLALPVLGILLTQFLRDELLTRPDFDGLGWVTNTFPSGHAAAAAGCVAAIVRASPRSLSPVAAVAGVGWLTLVSQDLMVWGWHRPSDLIGSVLLAAALMHLVPPSRARGSGENYNRMLVGVITAAVAAVGPLVWAVTSGHLAVAPVGLAAAVAIASLVADRGPADGRGVARGAVGTHHQRVEYTDRSGGQQDHHGRMSGVVD
ncbi:phosphatase PAP2 family protein [Williamsia sp.]|uniref:phosphatase PAP2 family protein n=1 Tax=Williamsia sp. TaxID=1872085 RepID=UPI002F91E7B9